MTITKFNSIDNMIRDFFSEFPAAAGTARKQDPLHFPPVNITETEKAFLLEMSVPGFEKNDFQIGMDGRLLNISAESKSQEEETSGKKIRREFSTRAFRRSFTLDEMIDTENIGAAYDKGILTVELPKMTKEEIKPKSIPVK